MQVAAEQSAAVGQSLLQFASTRVDDGQRQLAHFIKLKLSTTGHPTAELLDYSEETSFLEPSFFAFFNTSSPAATLDQILYGTLPVEKRPTTIEAYADRQGVVSLPRLGQLIGDVRNQIVNAAPAAPEIRAGSTTHDVELVAPSHICGTEIEYATGPGSLFTPIWEKMCPENGIDHSEAIVRALEIIHAVDAELYRCLLAVTRQIVTFTAQDGESFATLAAHGAVFLHTTRVCDEVFFIEDLVHQCGHLLFNAATLDRNELIEIDPNTTLGDLIGEPSEERSLYVSLHGIFTECLMSSVLAESLETDIFDNRQTHELKGRLSLIMKRLQLDLSLIRNLDVFTPAGRNLIESFGGVFDDVFASAEAAIVDCDLRSQPYSFCCERFAELNSPRA